MIKLDKLICTATSMYS